MEEMSRQGLYLWLKDVVESGRCPGVKWLDREDGTFQIPWSNQKSRCWQKEDSSIFLEYAKHTCKYKPGDKMDFPKWKQNLKSAINKNRYIERHRQLDNLTGPKPYRVYQFKNERGDRKRHADDTSELPISVEVSGHVIGRPVAMETSEGLFDSEILLEDRSRSIISPGLSCSESGSASSPTLSGASDFNALSPDIPRDDFCDRNLGNIPTFVDSFCEDVAATGVQSPSAPDITTAMQDSQVITTVSQTTTTVSTVNESNKQCSLINPAKQRQAQTNTQVQSAAASLDIIPQSLQGSVLQTPLYSRAFPFPLVTDNNNVRLILADGNALGFPGFQTANLSSRQQLLTSSGTCVLENYPKIPQTQLHQTEPIIVSSVCANGNPPIINTRESFVVISEMGLHGDSSYNFSSIMDTKDTVSLPNGHSMSGTQFTTYRNCQIPKAVQQNALPVSPVHISEDSVMHVQVLYGIPHRTVEKRKLTATLPSCRLYHGSVNTVTMQKAIQGTQNALEVELPSVETLEYDDKIKTVIRKILKDMELGIVISYRDDDIFVERRCLPKVYLSDGVSTSEELPRSTRKRPAETKAFDFKKFKNSLDLHSRNEKPVPKDHFLLTIGYQIIANDDSPTRQVPVYAVVRHVLAANERFKILGASTIAPNPMCSDPNSFDKTVALFKDIDLK